MDIVSLYRELDLEREKSVMHCTLRAIRSVLTDLIKPEHSPMSGTWQKEANSLVRHRLNPPYLVNLRKGIPIDIEPVRNRSQSHPVANVLPKLPFVHGDSLAIPILSSSALDQEHDTPARTCGTLRRRRLSEQPRAGYTRRGTATPPHRLPIIPGHELAGEVVEVGDEVSD
jgi:hypothetical protein